MAWIFGLVDKDLMQRQGGKGCEYIWPENQWGQAEGERDGRREEDLRCGWTEV